MDLHAVCVAHCFLFLLSLWTPASIALRNIANVTSSPFGRVLNGVFSSNSEAPIPSKAIPSNSLTIEILPSDEEDGDGLLNFSTMSDVYEFSKNEGGAFIN